MPSTISQATSAHSTPATKRPGPLRRVKFGFVKGALYCRIIEYDSAGRERTVAWLGRSPSESRIKAAARLFNARLPRRNHTPKMEVPVVQ